MEAVTRTGICIGLLLTPSLVAAQAERDALRPRLDSLLAVPDVESVIDDLDERFMGHLFMLVPDLAPEDSEVLAEAVGNAFEASAVRLDIVNAMEAPASPEVLTELLRMRQTGSQAEMSRIAEAYEPTQSLADFVAELGTAERTRLQLMATLVEAYGISDFGLLLEDALGALAHDLVNALGGGLGPFERMSDEVFRAAYRDRTITLAVEFLHRFESVPDSLVRSVILEYNTDAARWYVDVYAAAMLTAVQAAGQRLVALTVVAEEQVETEQSPAAEGVLCWTQACGFVLDWGGSEPQERSGRYGAAGDLELLVLRSLVGRGYWLERGRRGGGLTVRLRPRTTSARCDFLPGTDTRSCLAIDQVRVEFLGSYLDLDTPNNFSVRNRCGANDLMDVDGISALLALRLHYALTASESEDRDVPNC